MGYLLIAVVLTIVGSIVLVHRHRKPPWPVEGFQRELRALVPDERPTGRDRAP